MHFKVLKHLDSSAQVQLASQIEDARREKDAVGVELECGVITQEEHDTKMVLPPNLP